jgi:hypothetical protein
MNTTMFKPHLSRELDLQQLSQELVRRQETKEDYLADTRQMGFYWNQEASNYSITLDSVSDDMPYGFPVNEYCHGQLGSRLNIPKRYYDRMRSTAPSLLERNVRHWFLNEPERRMVRTLDGEARAYLSDRYRRLDDYDLMQAVLPVFEEIQGLQFHVASLTPTNLYVRALLPGLEREIVLGDVVQAGVEIRNSEVGSGALQVTPFIWRLACLNGMVIADAALRKYHTGRKVTTIEEDLSIYSDETLKLDDRAFFSKVRDMVRAALSETQFELIVGQLRAAATGVAIVNPVAAVERLDKTFGLSDTEQEDIVHHLARGLDLSAWGAVNAVTATAKLTSTFTRQVELEEIGGKIADLAPKQWSQIANGTNTLAVV